MSEHNWNLTQVFCERCGNPFKVLKVIGPFFCRMFCRENKKDAAWKLHVQRFPGK